MRRVIWPDLLNRLKIIFYKHFFSLKIRVKSFIEYSVSAQVFQTRNVSIGIVAQHSKYEDLYGEKIYCFCNLRK